MRRLSTQDADFQQQFSALLAFETVNDPELIKTVDQIIEQVNGGGYRVLTVAQAHLVHVGGDDLAGGRNGRYPHADRGF